MSPRSAREILNRPIRCDRGRSRLAGWQILVLALALGFAGGWLSPAGPFSQATSVSARPAAQAGPQQQAGAAPLAVPVLNFGSFRSGQVDDICRSWIAVQNVGERPSQALMVAWGLAYPLAPDPGPLKVECSGLIRPGSSWDLLGAQVPTGSFSGMIFSFEARLLSELGVDLGFDDGAASYFCDLLFFEVVGDPAEYARFRAAYDSGASFGGVPLALAKGAQLSAQVMRNCPGNLTPGVELASSYAAFEIEAERSDEDGYRYHVAPAFARPAAGSVGRQAPWSMAYVQNSSAVTATVEASFRHAGDCSGAEVACGTLVITPGSSLVVDVLACAGSGSFGALRLDADQRLAVLLDSVGSDGLSSHGAAAAPSTSETPTEGDYWLEGGSSSAADTGWDNLVSVTNPGQRPARVQVEFLDAGGASIWQEARDLCPGGNEIFRWAATDDLPGIHPVRVRVRSSSNLPGQAGPPVLASLRSTEFEAGAVGDLRSTAADRLEPLPSSQGVPLARDPMPVAGGQAVLSLPLLTKDLDGTGQISELALVNHNLRPGWTDVALLRYDVNALASVRCHRLRAGETQYIDLATQHRPWQGARGSLLVSAAWWTHAEDGFAYPPILGASLIWRTGTRIGEDVPGDELAITRGIPVQSLPESLRSPMSRRCAPEPSAIAPTATPPSGPNPRADALAALSHLPALRDLGQNDVCRAELTIRNRGTVDARALLVIHDEPGFVAPQYAGPIDSLCTDPIAPGAQLSLPPEELPSGAFSARVYSLGPATLAEAGVDPGSSDPLSEAVCQQVADEIVGDPRDDRRFHLAWLTGGIAGQLPLSEAVGPPLTVEVERTCPGDTTPGLEMTASYEAPTGEAYDLRDPEAQQQQFRYSVLPVMASYAGYNSLLYIQNAGHEGADVQLHFSSLGDCISGRVCRIFGLAPGEAYQWDVSDCVGPGWVGSVVVRSSQPLAIMAERIGRDQLHTLVTRQGDQPFDLNGDGRVDEADPARVEAAIGSQPGAAAWDPMLDLNTDGQIDQDDVEWARAGLCRWHPEPSELQPPQSPAPRRQVHLPALSHDGPDAPVCDPEIGIQNVGDVASKAILVLWGPRSANPDSCAGPAKVECSGLLAPGGSWTWADGMIGNFASGTIYSVNGVLTTEELGLGLGFDDQVADLLCEALFFGVVGDCDDYRRFKQAWDSGGEFAQIEFGDERVLGAPLAVRVERECDSSGFGAPAGSRELAAYGGIADTQLAAWNEDVGGFETFVPIVVGDKAGLDSQAWLQNAGLETASVEVFMAYQNDCSARRACESLTIRAGESAHVGSQCFRPDAQGTLWIRSDQPLATVVEMRGRGIRYAYAARPARIQRDLAGEDLPAAPGTRLFAPLSPLPMDGWDLGVNVQSADLQRGAWVDVEFLDTKGLVMVAYEAYICPGNTETFFVPISTVAQAARGSAAGSIRVTSRPPELAPWEPAGTIKAVAWHFRYEDATRNSTLESIAYELLPENHVGTWPLGSGAGGTETGTALVALPNLVYEPDAGDARSVGRIAVANLVGLPGRTEAQLILLEGDGRPVLRHPLELGPSETALVDLADLGLDPGFRGSALVSATHWDHGLPGPVDSGRQMVGLGAVGVTVRGPDVLGAGLAGPRMSVVAGEPLRQLPLFGEDVLPPVGPGPLLLPFLLNGF